MLKILINWDAFAFSIGFYGNYHDFQVFNISTGLAEWGCTSLYAAVCCGFPDKKELKTVLTKRDRAQIEEHFFDWLSVINISIVNTDIRE